MRHPTVWRSLKTAASLFPALLLAAPLHAASSMPRSERDLCAKIRAAVKEGRSIDQIASEFGTDQEHVARCLQQRSRRRKTTPSTRKKKKPKAAPAETRSEARESGAATKSTSQQRQPKPQPKQPLGVRVVP